VLVAKCIFKRLSSSKHKLSFTELQQPQPHNTFSNLPTLESTEMGIKDLSKVIAEHASKAVKEGEMKAYFGRKVAVDASMSLYQVGALAVYSTQQMFHSACSLVPDSCAPGGEYAD